MGTDTRKTVRKLEQQQSTGEAAGRKLLQQQLISSSSPGDSSIHADVSVLSSADDLCGETGGWADLLFCSRLDRLSHLVPRVLLSRVYLVMGTMGWDEGKVEHLAGEKTTGCS